MEELDCLVINLDARIENCSKFSGDGLYFIELEDKDLFCGNNWYSDDIINFAIAEGIEFKFKYHIAGTKRGKLFISKIKEILIKYGDAKFTKNIINTLSGMCGSTYSTRTNLNNDNKGARVFDYIKKNGGVRDCFWNKWEEANFNDIYFFGKTTKMPKHDQNLPIYLQILDGQLISLYKMGKTLCEGKGKILYRKTDCIVISNIPSYISNDTIGGYSTEKFPNKLVLEHYNDVAYEYKKIHWKKTGVRNSDDWDKIGDEGMIIGMAGTGKTFVANKLIEKLEKAKKEVVKLAFTNKACLNLEGQTFNSFFGIGIGDDPNWGHIHNLCKKIDYMIIDEISMIGGMWWNILTRVKERSNIKFIFFGDWRQLPPVREGDYFNSPNLHYLAGGILTELTVVKRYDEKLGALVNNLDNCKFKYCNEFCLDEGIANNVICYTNLQRQKLNTLMNDKAAIGKEYIKLNVKKKNLYSQDTKLFAGCKLMMATTTKCRKFKKNERVICSEVNDTYFTIVGIGNKTVSLKTKQFHACCVLGYASTIHKSQGDTLDGVLYIFEMGKFTNWTEDNVVRDYCGGNEIGGIWSEKKRLLYTALTRATKFNNLRLIRGGVGF